jgi:hypothetical protein
VFSVFGLLIVLVALLIAAVVYSAIRNARGR